jgi:hypothetical protein
MRRANILWTYGLGLLASALAHGFLGLPLGISLGLLAALAPTVVLVYLGLAARGDRHEVVAVRADPDFGRIALLDDGRWEGAVALAGLSRTVDVEIEATGEGPTLAQRLAYQDACAQLAGLLPELARATGLEDGQGFGDSARFLCLRLPAEATGAPDWLLSYATSDARDADCWEVAVRAGRILDVRRAA